MVRSVSTFVTPLQLRIRTVPLLWEVGLGRVGVVVALPLVRCRLMRIGGPLRWLAVGWRLHARRRRLFRAVGGVVGAVVHV